MEKQAKYILRIEIENLWGRFNIAWNLRPDVPIPKTIVQHGNSQ